MAFPTTRRWPKTAGSRWVAREKAAVLARFGKLSRELTKLALQGSKASFRSELRPKVDAAALAALFLSLILWVVAVQSTSFVRPQARPARYHPQPR